MWYTLIFPTTAPKVNMVHIRSTHVPYQPYQLTVATRVWAPDPPLFLHYIRFRLWLSVYSNPRDSKITTKLMIYMWYRMFFPLLFRVTPRWPQSFHISAVNLIVYSPAYVIFGKVDELSLKLKSVWAAKDSWYVWYGTCVDLICLTVPCANVFFFL